jgi:hypothetical protein
MPQISASHLLSLAQGGTRIAQDNASHLKQVRVIGNVERHVCVLLDQNDGGSGCANFTDNVENLFYEQGRQAQ